MVHSPSLVRSSILNTTQDTLFWLQIFSPQLLSRKFLHLMSQVAISNHAHSFSLHLPPCQDDWPSPSSTEYNRKIVLMAGVNERVMTSSECTSYISQPWLSQISGVRKNLLPFPFLNFLFCLTVKGVGWSYFNRKVVLEKSSASRSPPSFSRSLEKLCDLREYY